MIPQTSYNANATPPSPQSASPTLTLSTSESNSNSNASPSPSHLRTPPRYSRSKTRYPDLGRVPLHRRGTSRTYERLEDLLREAGYKDTRIFTPEGEHREEAADEAHDLKDDAEKRSSIRGGVGAVVGFLAGLMPSAVSRSSSLRRHDSYDAPSTAEISSPSPSRPYSPPSPLAHRQVYKQKQRTPQSSEPHSPSMMTSSVESLDHTPRPKRKSPSRSTMPVPPNMMYSHSQPTHNVYQRPQHQFVHQMSDQSTYTLQRPLLYPQTSRTSLHQTLDPAAGMSRIAHPRPSRAGAYLRTMASQPDIPKRPNSTPGRPPRKPFLLNDSDSQSAYNDNDVGHEQPPLPRTWLENVARAVLFGGMGAYVGGPFGPPSIIEPERESLGKTLRPTRSSISQVSPKHLRPQQSRSGLSDRTNTRSATSTYFLAPPELFTRIERGRARKSAGEVSRTRVVCRSAPVSRAGSPTRSVGSGNERRRAKKAREGKEYDPPRGRGRRDERSRLPSLARTKTEGDIWVKKQNKPPASGGANRYLTGWGIDPNSDGDGDDLGRSSSEDDGELNLAQMLVPPKRQNSIKSLRKHLDASLSATGVGPNKGVSKVRGAVVSAGGRNVRQRILEDEWDGSDAEDLGSGWVRKGYRKKNLGDEDEDVAYPGFLVDGRGFGLKNGVLGSGRSTSGKRRVGMPAPWGSIRGGS